MQAALTSLKMGAEPHIMPPTGQYLTLGINTEDGYLTVYTDAPSIMEYQVLSASQHSHSSQSSGQDPGSLMDTHSMPCAGTNEREGTIGGNY